MDKMKTKIFIALLFVTFGCATPEVQLIPSETRIEQNPPPCDQPRKLMVFFDGTDNELFSRTNVRRLFEIVSSQERPTNFSIYVDGVGSSSFPLIGAVLGYGIKARVLEGYKFLADNYRKGDKVYIFGFSRGAHQARALSGLLSYCGIPNDSYNAKDVMNFCIDQEEKDDETWRNWKPSDGVMLNTELSKELNITTQVAEIEFLGIWDTVPGSQFKKFDEFRELEDSVEGVRYKSQPYPTIKFIAHALSKDEKRSEFVPLFVRRPINPERTMLQQVWFPGAHSDVGGGYDDSNDLAGISLNWMLDLLTNKKQKKNYDGLFDGNTPTVFDDAGGLAHWSLGSQLGAFGSEYLDRIYGSPLLKDLTSDHPSIAEREEISKINHGVPVASCKNKQTGVLRVNYPYQTNVCVQKDQ